MAGLWPGSSHGRASVALHDEAEGQATALNDGAAAGPVVVGSRRGPYRTQRHLHTPPGDINARGGCWSVM